MEASWTTRSSGKVIARVRVIEFQSAGFRTRTAYSFSTRISKNSLRNPEKVDEIISAEIPGEEDADLRRIVLQHMVHNPCGEQNPSAVCMGDNGCKKYFPKPFRCDTQQSENEHYISYRRRSPKDGGETLSALFAANRTSAWTTHGSCHTLRR